MKCLQFGDSSSENLFQFHCIRPSISLAFRLCRVCVCAFAFLPVTAPFPPQRSHISWYARGSEEKQRWPEMNDCSQKQNAIMTVYNFIFFCVFRPAIPLTTCFSSYFLLFIFFLVKKVFRFFSSAAIIRSISLCEKYTYTYLQSYTAVSRKEQKYNFLPFFSVIEQRQSVRVREKAKWKESFWIFDRYYILHSYTDSNANTRTHVYSWSLAFSVVLWTVQRTIEWMNESAVMLLLNSISGDNLFDLCAHFRLYFIRFPIAQ